MHGVYNTCIYIHMYVVITGLCTVPSGKKYGKLSSMPASLIPVIEQAIIYTCIHHSSSSSYIHIPGVRPTPLPGSANIHDTVCLGQGTWVYSTNRLYMYYTCVENVNYVMRHLYTLLCFHVPVMFSQTYCWLVQGY